MKNGKVSVNGNEVTMDFGGGVRVKFTLNFGDEIAFGKGNVYLSVSYDARTGITSHGQKVMRFVGFESTHCQHGTKVRAVCDIDGKTVYGTHRAVSYPMADAAPHWCSIIRLEDGTVFRADTVSEKSPNVLKVAA